MQAGLGAGHRRLHHWAAVVLNITAELIWEVFPRRYKVGDPISINDVRRTLINYREHERARGWQARLDDFIAEAKLDGKVLTIGTEPLDPLAAGNYRMVGEVRDSHEVMRAKEDANRHRQLEKQALHSNRYGMQQVPKNVGVFVSGLFQPIGQVMVDIDCGEVRSMTPITGEFTVTFNDQQLYDVVAKGQQDLDEAVKEAVERIAGANPNLAVPYGVEPIPRDVYYIERYERFYTMHGHPKDHFFYEKWFERRAEFPKEPTE